MVHNFRDLIPAIFWVDDGSDLVGLSREKTDTCQPCVKLFVQKNSVKDNLTVEGGGKSVAEEPQAEDCCSLSNNWLIFITKGQRCFKYTWYEYKYEYKYTGSKYEYEYEYTRCEYEYEYEYTGHEYKYEYKYHVTNTFCPL